MRYDDKFKERFFSGIKKDKSGCWLWQRSCFKFGYGQIKYKGKNLKAHRVSYEIHKGEIPKDKLVCHKCNVPQCCNPEHLYAGTHKDNSRDQKIAGTSYFDNLDQKGEKNISSVLDSEKCAKILDLFLTNKYTQQQIADEIGCSRRAVGRFLDGTTAYIDEPVTVENHTDYFLGSRITKYGLFTILELYNSGYAIKEIADIVGTKEHHTSRLLRGERNVKWFEEYYTLNPEHKVYQQRNKRQLQSNCNIGGK